VRGALIDVADVRSVHDLHVWTVGNGQVALSCHVVVPSEGSRSTLLSEIYQVLGSRFGIGHATIQVEPESFAGQTPQSVCSACD